MKTRNLTPMKVTLELPDEWAASFPARETEWAEVVTAGLHRRQSRLRQEINHFADMADTLAELPSPEQVLALHPSPALAERIQFLLAKKNKIAMPIVTQVYKIIFENKPAKHAMKDLMGRSLKSE